MSDVYSDINDDQPRKLFDAAGSFGTPARFDKVLASATDAQLKYRDEHSYAADAAATLLRLARADRRRHRAHKDFIGYGVHATDAHQARRCILRAYGRTEAEKVLRERADGTVPNKFAPRQAPDKRKSS